MNNCWLIAFKIFTLWYLEQFKNANLDFVLEGEIKFFLGLWYLKIFNCLSENCIELKFRRIETNFVFKIIKE